MAQISSGKPQKDASESGSGQTTAHAAVPAATGVPVVNYDTAAEKYRDGKPVKATT